MVENNVLIQIILRQREEIIALKETNNALQKSLKRYASHHKKVVKESRPHVDIPTLPDLSNLSPDFDCISDEFFEENMYLLRLDDVMYTKQASHYYQQHASAHSSSFSLHYELRTQAATKIQSIWRMHYSLKHYKSVVLKKQIIWEIAEVLFGFYKKLAFTYQCICQLRTEKVFKCLDIGIFDEWEDMMSIHGHFLSELLGFLQHFNIWLNFNEFLSLRVRSCCHVYRCTFSKYTSEVIFFIWDQNKLK